MSESKRHRWAGSATCVDCGLHRKGAGAGPYGAMRYYRDDDDMKATMTAGACPGREPCVDCGAKDATFGPDPFLVEIEHDHAPMWMCASCRNTSRMEI